MDNVKHSALQDQWGLYYFVQTDITVNDIITVLDAYKLASGFVSCVMLIPTIQSTYLGAGWIPHLRARLAALDGHMSIEKAWTPHLQRRDNDSIMEVIADCRGLTPKEKQLANKTRIWLRVICISDLADIEGVIIAWNRLTGKWRAISARNWV